MKISNIILFSFFIILLLFSITTYLNYALADLTNENTEVFERSSLVVRHSNRFQRNFLNMVSGLRGYLLTTEGFFIQSYDSAVQENEDILKELAILVPEHTQQQDLLRDIRQLHSYWIQNFAVPLLEARKNTQRSDSTQRAFDRLYRVKLVDGLEKDVQASLQRKFSQFINFEYRLRESAREELQESVRYTKTVTISLTIISIVVGTGIAVFIAYNISSKIINMVIMANAIAGGNYEVHIYDRGKNELSQLARALNRMARTLGTNITLLQRQRDELDQFAHIVSHDLKAPLRGIDNVVNWIEEDHLAALPKGVIEYLTLIKGRLARAEDMLKGILQYARIGKGERIKEIVDVNELLLEVRENLPTKPGISLTIQTGFPMLFTERIPLLQVFTNLMVNAYKYHDKQNGYVRVYFKDAGAYFEFFVEDNGPGIDPKYHQKIFRIFQTLHPRDFVESTGVGLSIVKKILDDRKLTIKLNSGIERGTIFSFLWPKDETHE